MFYNEAKRTDAIADRPLPGVGCLTIMFWLHVGGLALIGLAIIAMLAES